MEQAALVDFVSPDGPRATHARSTLISSSLETLRKLGLYDRLVAELPAAAREQLLYNFAPTWLPIELVEIYYDTWEHMELEEGTLALIGPQISERIMGSVLATLLRGARAAGATPWVPLKQYDRLWSRIFRGGAVKVIQRGPKEAVIESRGVAMLNGPRFCASYRAVLHAAGAMFAGTVYIRDLPSRQRDTQVLLVSWV